MDTPPPYSHAKVPPEPSEMMSQLQAVVDEDRQTSVSGAREAERLRNFILFALAIDYHRNKTAVLSAEDRQHYIAISNALSDLRNAQDHTHLRAQERSALAPYFWKYLHEPCCALGIPVECATKAINRFCKFQDHAGRYKGSAYGIAHTYGLDQLARKLHMDMTVLVPRLIADVEARQDMLQGVKAFEQLYFESIRGMESSTMPSETLWAGWADMQTVTYTLNERGIAYEKRRAEAGTTAKNGECLSPSHWALRIKSVTTSLLKRKETFPEGKKVSDNQGTWKGPDRPPEGTPRSNHLWQVPYGWCYRASTHLPDFFEHRPRKNVCDT